MEMHRNRSSNADLLAPSPRAIVIPFGEDERLDLRDVVVAFKAMSDDTFGAWSLLEYTLPPRTDGPPAHCHRRATEAYYVVEGTLRFVAGDQSMDIGSGGFVLARPGLTPAFANVTDSTTRFLMFASPGGIERYYDGLAQLLLLEKTWPPGDMRPYEELGLQHDHYPPE